MKWKARETEGWRICRNQRKIVRFHIFGEVLSHGDHHNAISTPLPKTKDSVWNQVTGYQSKYDHPNPYQFFPSTLNVEGEKELQVREREWWSTISQLLVTWQKIQGLTIIRFDYNSGLEILILDLKQCQQYKTSIVLPIPPVIIEVCYDFHQGHRKINQSRYTKSSAKTNSIFIDYIWLFSVSFITELWHHCYSAYHICNFS